MSRDPRAFAAIDAGTASIAASLVGHVDGRWRLLASGAVPAAVGVDPLLARLARRVAAADPGLARRAGLAGSPVDAADPAAFDAPDVPRIVCRTSPPPTLVVVAASQRALEPLLGAADAAGWRTRGLALDGVGAIDAAAAMADPDCSTVLAGAGDPPGADERGLLPELTTLLAAAVARRPDLAVVLAGGLAEPGGRAEQLIAGDRPGGLLLAPAASAGDPPGAPLRELLEAARAPAEDGRRALARAAVTLAGVLGRRIEVVEVGQSGGARIAAAPVPGGGGRLVLAASVAAAGLVRPGVDGTVDEVAGWLTIPVDRLRLRDRLAELALSPWADAAGDGALVRLAAARAALGRLVAATPGFARLPPAEVLVATGGAWSVAPGAALALALADAIRRPGAAVLGHDHARLLAPLGMIEDEAERATVIADLRDDLLVPLGSVVIAADVRPGRTAGRVTVHAAAGPVELDLVPGGLELVDLPPGTRATVELRFREDADVGARARHVTMEVAGGLGGLLIDLRDVPLRLPERPDRRRDLLASWQAALWPGADA